MHMLHCCQYYFCFFKLCTHLEFSALAHFKVYFCNWNCCLDQKVVIWSNTCTVNSQYFFSVSLYAHVKSVIKAVFLKSLILQKLMCIHPLALPYKANHLCLIGSLLFYFCVILWGYCKVLEWVTSQLNSCIYRICLDWWIIVNETFTFQPILLFHWNFLS